MAMFKNKLKRINYLPGNEVPESRNGLYLADNFIPKMPRLLPSGLNNPNNNFWNK